ncbi:MAG: hypothetical protein ACLP0A_07985 [Verrucomicrobiia bacterium]
MKAVRLAYLAFVTALACAHMFLTLSPWTAPAFAAGNSGTHTVVWLVVLFAGWIVAVVADLVMSVLGILSLSFAGEAVLCNASLVVLSVLSGGLAYLVWAVAAPTIVLVKAIEEFAGHHSEGHFWPRIHAN